MSKTTFEEELAARLSTFGSEQGGLETSDIKGAQKALNILIESGALAGSQIPEDGLGGPATSNAVLAWQQGNGLSATGQIDQDTVTSLIAGVDGVLQKELGSPPAKMLTVKHVQAGLNLLGGSLAEDGQMGPATRAAIGKFQSDDGLTINPNVIDGAPRGPVTPSPVVPGNPAVTPPPAKPAGITPASLLGKMPKITLPRIPVWGWAAGAGVVLAGIAAALGGHKR